MFCAAVCHIETLFHRLSFTLLLELLARHLKVLKNSSSPRQLSSSSGSDKISPSFAYPHSLRERRQSRTELTSCASASILEWQTRQNCRFIGVFIESLMRGTQRPYMASTGLSGNEHCVCATEERAQRRQD